MGRLSVLVVAGLVLASCQWQLGGPNNTFGNDPTRVGAQPNVWAAIQGPFTRHQDGDPYTTMCSTDVVTKTTCDTTYGTTGTGGSPLPAAVAQNSMYDPNGYSWAIDVPQEEVGTTVSVQIYDPAIYDVGAPLSENSGGPTIDFHTSYELFATTGNSLDPSETPDLSLAGKCGSGPGQQTFGYGQGSGAPYYSQQWFTLCSFTPTQAGVYPLQVKTSDIPGLVDAGSGWNVYSVKAVATAGSSQPDVYALTHLSMWMPGPASTASFYLANIPSSQAGHTLVVDLFDPGDGVAGPAPVTMKFLAPPSGLGVVPSGGTSTACNYNASGSPVLGPPAPNTSTNCTIVTEEPNSGVGLYNNYWLRVEIPIPASYSCTTDCWWSATENFGVGAAPTDRLTLNADVLVTSPG